MGRHGVLGDVVSPYNRRDAAEPLAGHIGSAQRIARNFD